MAGTLPQRARAEWYVQPQLLHPSAPPYTYTSPTDVRTATASTQDPGTRREVRLTAPVKFDHVEQRTNDAGETELQVRGYAAVFDADSEVLGYWSPFIERIKRGAFRKALAKKPDVRFLFNHDGITLARSTNGTLSMKEDARGLLVHADLNPGMQAARDVFAAIERGDVSQMSFAFTVASDQWDYRDEDHDLRTILEVGDLFDVSAVSYPAYPDTDIESTGSGGERGSGHEGTESRTGEVSADEQRNGTGTAGEQLPDSGSSDDATSPASKRGRYARRLAIIELEQ